MVHFSSREKRSRNVLKMSLVILAVFFLLMSPFVVYLSLSLFSPDGKFCLSKDFRFVTQYLVHANGIMNFFTYFTFNQSYRRGFVSILSRIFCSCCSICDRRKEVEVTSTFGQESYAASYGTVNFGMVSDSRDVVLTGVRSVESAELKVVENGNM